MVVLWLFPVGALSMTLVGVGLLVNGVRRSREWRDFASRAEVASAEVVALRRRTVRETGGPNRRAVLVPVVRFATVDGTEVQSMLQYVGATPGVREGGRIDVRYDPDDPRRVNALRGPARGSVFAGAQLVVGTGLVLIGGAATAGTTALVLALTG